MTRPATTVQRIHFEDFDGRQFERLAFIYHLRTEKSAEWYGQSGSDEGRDIWVVEKSGETICVQCANHQRLKAEKALRDIDKITKRPSGLPKRFRLICGSVVSAKTRDKIKTYALAMGIGCCEIWSGEEFEERLRQQMEGVLRRFIEGVMFPDAPDAMWQFLAESECDDLAAVRWLSRVFDRPAFQTPFQQESSISGFRQAIDDSVQVLNTGIWQTRDGKEIARLKSRHDLRDPHLKKALADIVRDLVSLRTRFDDLMRVGEIRACGCGKPDCPVFFCSPMAAEEMNDLRSRLLANVLTTQQLVPVTVPAGDSVTVNDTQNCGIIANKVTIRGDVRKSPIILPGSIGSEPPKYNYAEYLVKRLTDFRDKGTHYGQTRGRVHPGATRKILERHFGGLPKDLPAERFEEIVQHLKHEIDRTALGRNNRSRNIQNYHTFSEHGLTTR